MISLAFCHPRDPDIQFSGGMLLPVHAAWLRPLTSRAAGSMSYGTLVLLLGVSCQEENVAPRKLVPGKHKIGSLGFLVSVVEATLNLRGPRIEI